MATFILRPTVLLTAQRSARLCLKRAPYSLLQTRHTIQNPPHQRGITKHAMDSGLHGDDINSNPPKDRDLMPLSFWQWVHSGASLPPTQPNGSPWPLIEGKNDLVMYQRLSRLHNDNGNLVHLDRQVKVMKNNISAQEPPFSMVEFTRYVDASLDGMLEKDIAKWMVLLRDLLNVFNFLNLPEIAAAFTTTQKRSSQEVCFYTTEWNRLIETGKMQNERKIHNAAELIEEFHNFLYPELARLAREHFEEAYRYALEKLEARKIQDESVKIWRERLMTFYKYKMEMRYPGF